MFDVKALLRGAADKYLDEFNLARNAHMHRWSGEEPSREVVKICVDALIESTNFLTDNNGHVAEELARCAKVLGEREGDLTRAILVDYANWAAQRHCGIDLALYASDLEPAKVRA